MEIHAVQQSSGKLPAEGSGSSTALVSGRTYKALITAAKPGTVEILIGNRYYSANTSLRLRMGESVWLLLASTSGGRYVFRVAVPNFESASELSNSPAAYLKAVGLSPTPDLETSLELLSRHGVEVSAKTLEIGQQLISTFGLERAAAFLPELKVILKLGLNIDSRLLLQMAMTATATRSREILAPLSQQQSEQHGKRQRGRQRRSKIAGITIAPGSDVNASTVHNAIATLLGSPESQLRDAFLQNAGIEGAHASIDLRGILNQDHGGQPDLAEDLVWFEAQRLMTVISPSGSLRATLPLLVGSEESALHLELQELGTQYYERETLLRLRLSNDTQGTVEISLHSRGNRLRVDITAGSKLVSDAYLDEVALLEEQLHSDGLLTTGVHCNRIEGVS